MGQTRRQSSQDGPQHMLSCERRLIPESQPLEVIDEIRTRAVAEHVAHSGDVIQLKALQGSHIPMRIHAYSVQSALLSLRIQRRASQEFRQDLPLVMEVKAKGFINSRTNGGNVLPFARGLTQDRSLQVKATSTLFHIQSGIHCWNRPLIS